MSWKQGNPGCPCCIPTCYGEPSCYQSLFGTPAAIGDSAGTYTLNYIGGPQPIWQTGVITYNLPCYRGTPGDFPCIEDGNNLKAFYRFQIIQCAPAGDPNAGKILCSLGMSFEAICCGPTFPTMDLHYGSGSPPTIIGTGAIKAAWFPCGTTVFDFNYITDTPVATGCTGTIKTLPIPGGGGALSVVF